MNGFSIKICFRNAVHFFVMHGWFIIVAL